MNKIRTFRAARNWTLQQLADAAGTSKSQIDKLEKGDRRLTVDWMVRLAKPLGCDPRDLMTATADPKFHSMQFGTSATTSHPALIPVHALQPNETSKKLTHNLGRIIDHIPRPYTLAHVEDAYALYMAGDVMIPMYRPRQLLFVNPYKMPLPGNGVVITDKKGAVIIREYVKQKSGSIIVREYQPQQRDITVSTKDIASLHAIVGAAEP